MRTLFVLMSFLLSVSVQAKVRTNFKNIEVLQHVLASEEFQAAQQEEGGLGELYNVQIEKKGEMLNAKYTVNMHFVRPSIGHGGTVHQTPCTLRANIGVEIKTKPNTRITYSQLSTPKLTGPACALAAPR